MNFESMGDIKKITHCRICKKSQLEKIFSFGQTPLANAFLRKTLLDHGEMFYPLVVYRCTNCSLVQLGHVVSPELLFKDYIYVSSTSPVFIQHFENFAGSVVSKFKLKKSELVVDIGSNDGVLLHPFNQMGCRVVGIEPATKIAQLAKSQGIETLNEFFSIQSAKQVLSLHGPAKIITATNVFAHIDNLDVVIEGVKIILDRGGVFIIEVPYLADFVSKNLFDTVYHEHLSYFALKPLITLFRRFDMDVFDVERVDSHGGSLRVFISKGHKHQMSNRVGDLLIREKELGLESSAVYRTFYQRILVNRARLLTMLSQLKAKNKVIIGYGAPAKGNTLLNFFGIGTESLEYIADDSTWKQGLYTPGKHIPVVSPSQIYKSIPDYIVILAWNFAANIMAVHKKFSKHGGKFIVPVPYPTIVS